jgi:hypothetical protein
MEIWRLEVTMIQLDKELRIGPRGIYTVLESWAFEFADHSSDPGRVRCTYHKWRHEQ